MVACDKEKAEEAALIVALVKRLAQSAGISISCAGAPTNPCCATVALLQVTATAPSGPVTLSAKAAVITLPLGVLKARAAALFTPPLPADKQRAIEALGMGLLNKVRPQEEGLLSVSSVLQGVLPSMYAWFGPAGSPSAPLCILTSAARLLGC
jgi:hypothetical protein